MNNCIIAQSGGPTAVINASIMGVVAKNNELKYYDNVFGGMNGIEGILNEDMMNLSQLSNEEVETIKYTPAAALGSCRYKLKSYETNEGDYIKLFQILEKNHIKTFFYTGGNDSMDTVHKLSIYAKKHNKHIKFIGIPKTIDNDLPIMDHTPGYGSAAKLIALTCLENYLDASVYAKKSAFIVETMGRDTGWLAASAAIATINEKCVVDFIYLPEIVFSEKQFLEDVKSKLDNQKHVFIVVSEGIKNEHGRFLSELNTSTEKDIFGHVQLGGVGNYIKSLLIDNGIVSKARTLEISTTQRCGMHCASQTDIDESFNIGQTAMRYSIEGENGMMVGIKRVSNNPYKAESFVLDTEKVANQIKYFPTEWVNGEGNHIKNEAVEYILPLIQGESKVKIENGLPKYYKARENK